MKHFRGNISSGQHCAYNLRWQHHFTVPIRGWSLMMSCHICMWCCLLSVGNALSIAWFIFMIGHSFEKWKTLLGVMTPIKLLLMYFTHFWHKDYIYLITPTIYTCQFWKYNQNKYNKKNLFVANISSTKCSCKWVIS